MLNDNFTNLHLNLAKLIFIQFLQSLRLNITERDMEKEHQKQVQKRKAEREAKSKGPKKTKNKIKS